MYGCSRKLVFKKVSTEATKENGHFPPHLHLKTTPYPAKKYTYLNLCSHLEHFDRRSHIIHHIVD